MAILTISTRTVSKDVGKPVSVFGLTNFRASFNLFFFRFSGKSKADFRKMLIEKLNFFYS